MHTLLCSVSLTLQQATVDSGLHWRPPGHSQARLAQSLLILILLAPGAHKALSVPSKSLFPQSCGCSVIKSHWPPKSNCLRVLSHFAGYPGWESVVGPRTFLTVQEFIWYNCSSVCGSSAWWLYGGVNGDLLQEGLCHTLGDPGLLHPKPLPLRQATADLYLCRRQTNTQR